MWKTWRPSEFRYGDGLPVAGQWTGRLSNSTETISLLSHDITIQQFAYLDTWHPTTDGNGFSLQVLDAANVDLTSWSIGASWRPSNAPGGTPGSPPSADVPGDIDGILILDDRDIDLLAAAIRADSSDPRFDLNLDGNIDRWDREHLIHNVIGTVGGDSNLDGQFDFTDLELVTQSGEYDDAIPGNSTWSDGDWNGDGEFNSADLVYVFQLQGFLLD